MDAGLAQWKNEGEHALGSAMFIRDAVFPRFGGSDGGDTCADGSRLLVHVLGPVGVCRNGSEVPIGKARTRAVLAYLVIHRGSVVPADVMVDALWAGDAPDGARHAVQVAVSSLRSILGSAPAESASERIVSFPSGYMLELGHQELDVAIAQDLAGKARALTRSNRLEDAENCLLTAEALWRGPPFAEFLYAEFAQAPIRQLEEFRLGLTEDRIDVQLDLGRHHEILPELEALVLEHPSRERFLGQLMIALYRSDRPLDAELAFERAAERLRREYGAMPGKMVRELASDLRTSSVDIS